MSALITVSYFSTTIADLDIPIIKKEFLPKAVAEDVLAEDRRSIEEQLASFDFSLITAFRVVEKVSKKYFEEGLLAMTVPDKPTSSRQNTIQQ